MLQPWVLAIALILVLQTTSAFLSRLVPIISPAFMAEFGWDESWIGYLTAANIAGALVILFACAGLVRQLGGVRALQLTLLIGAAALVLLHVPSVAVALVASALIGLSNGTANPAGSEVLQRYTPQAHRNFVFSIKQAGVPLGGVIAGLSIPPLVETVGWRTTLVVAGLAAALATVLMWPFQSRIDGPRDRSAPWRPHQLTLGDLAVPLRSLTAGDGLMRMAVAGALLAIAQACWFAFAVTYAVVGLGQSLSVAGLVFATMQATSVIGRVAAGWLADHAISSTATLAVSAVGSALTTALFALATPAWPVWALLLLAAAAGVTVSAWNGVQVAEVARRSPPHMVGETAAGSVILVFASNLIAPVAFAAFVAATKRFDVAFIAAGACSLACLPLLWGMDRKAGPG